MSFISPFKIRERFNTVKEKSKKANLSQEIQEFLTLLDCYTSQLVKLKLAAYGEKNKIIYKVLCFLRFNLSERQTISAILYESDLNLEFEKLDILNFIKKVTEYLSQFLQIKELNFIDELGTGYLPKLIRNVYLKHQQIDLSQTWYDCFNLETNYKTAHDSYDFSI